MLLMLRQSANEAFLEIAEEWLFDCYDEDGEGVEPEYLYMQKDVAQILYGLVDLDVQFYVTEFSNNMVKLLPKEKIIAH
jgi:hypothetical protein